MAKERTNNRPPRQHGPMGASFGAPAAKAAHFKESLIKLVRYLRSYYWQIAAVIILVVTSTTMTIVGPKMLGEITNTITDDYIAIKTYETVQKNLPKNITLPAGTTLSDLLKMMAKTPNGQGSKAANQHNQMDNLKLTDSQKNRLMSMDITKRPQVRFDAIGQIAALLIAIYLLAAAFSYIESWILAGMTQKIAYQLRLELSQKINTLPLKYFDKNSFGDVMSRITNDVDAVAQNLSQVISTSINSLAMVIGIIAMMLSISIQLTLVAALIIPPTGLIMVWLMKKSGKYFKAQQETLGLLNGHIEETYSGHNIVKIFGAEKMMAKQFNKHNDKLYESAWKAQFISSSSFPTISFLGNLGYIATAAMGGHLVLQGKIGLGDVQAFIQYTQQFNQPIVQLANIANTIQLTVASAERVFEFLDEHDEAKTWQGRGQSIDNIRGHVEFNHVKFGYDKDQLIIKDFSAKIKAGQKIAIVGPTGAGKTTLINLLMRFYDPVSGSIKIDGIDTIDMSRAEVRRQFGMVLQDTWLFNDTIRSNLTYGKPDATDEELDKAVKSARAYHIIKSLPNGYDTMISEDSDNISAGEKQLLTIARAMLVNSPIMILDEATSNVDTRTEGLIQSAMDELMKGRTSFIIAHRLSTIKNADLILVLNHGDIIESGNHDELLDKNGFYAKLYNSQFSE